MKKFCIKQELSAPNIRVASSFFVVIVPIRTVSWVMELVIIVHGSSLVARQREVIAESSGAS